MIPTSPVNFTPQRSELRHGFLVAGLCLVPAARVLTEVVAQVDVFPVPKSSNALMGVMNLRGAMVPLFAPSLLGQGLSHITPTKRQALVFDREEQSLAILLEGTPELMSIVPAVGTPTRPVSLLADYLTLPWVRQDQPQQIWWEFNHRAAFEFLARAHSSFLAPSATNVTASNVNRTEVIL